MIFVNRSNAPASLEKVKKTLGIWMGCLLIWGLQGKNVFQQDNSATWVTVSSSFRIHRLLLQREGLPDISGPFVVVTLLSRDVMLSTDPHVVLEPRRRCYSGCPCPSPLRCQVLTQRKRLFLCLGPFPELGVCSGRPDKNHALNWQLTSRSQAGRRLHTRELAEVLLPGRLAANRPPSFGLRSRFSCWDRTPAQRWQLGHGGAQTWCPRLRQARGKFLLQRRGDSLLAWVNPLFSDLRFISAKISSPDEKSTIISNG